jgi:hypothetical protein
LIEMAARIGQSSAKVVSLLLPRQLGIIMVLLIYPAMTLISESKSINLFKSRPILSVSL